MSVAFTRVAVLNRGEAAIRFLSALREYNRERGTALVGVACTTDPDVDAPFVRLAHESIALGPAFRPGPDGTPRSAYTDVDHVLALLAAHRCDAVWPGWGFASEDAGFVARLEEEGITFLGPPSGAMRLLGDKLAARRLAEAHGVPLAPWAEVPLDLPEEAVRERAAAVGWPLMVKATNGGGGRGIRRVERPEDLGPALARVRDEVARAFGRGGVFLEACVTSARHVEVQFVVDADGRAATLGTRDCSIQRRHQKVVEEAPCPVLPPLQEDRLCRAVVQLVEAAGYRGVGTAEFLCTLDGRQTCFLEVNSRLQVEHTVTEAITGCDLVKAQIDVARGLPWRPAGVRPQGHAIQVRLNAESPERGFAPAPGQVRRLRLPAGPGVRVDAGIQEGMTIPTEFDPTVAKIVAWAPTRVEAIARLERALEETQVLVADGETNQAFLRAVLAHPAFREATADTGWLDREGALVAPGGERAALLFAAVLQHRFRRRERRQRFFAEVRHGIPLDLPAPEGLATELRLRGQVHALRVHHLGGDRYLAGPPGALAPLEVRWTEDGTAWLDLDGRRHAVLFAHGRTAIGVEIDGATFPVEPAAGGAVRATSPGLVVHVHVAEGDRVEVGTRLCTLEAMKMEVPVFAREAGVVRAVRCHPNQQVSTGQVLLLMESEAVAALPTAGLAFPPPPPRPLDVLFRDGTPAPEALDALTPEAAAGAVADLADVLRARILGREVPEDLARRALSVLEVEGRLATVARPERWEPLVALLGPWADLESLLDRNLLPLADAPVAESAEIAFFEWCRDHRAGAAGLRPELEPLLRRALRDLGVEHLEPSEDLREALLQVAVARAWPGPRHEVVAALLRALVELAAAGLDLSGRPDVASTLARVAALGSPSFPSVGDNAALCRYLFFERGRYAAHRAAVGSEVPGGDVRVLHPELAATFHLERWDAFHLEPLEGGRRHGAFRARAREDAADERILVFWEVRGALVAEPPEAEAPGLWEFRAAWSEALRVIRTAQAGQDPRRRLHRNRITIHFAAPAPLEPRQVVRLAGRFEAQARGLGLEKVVLVARRSEPEGLREVELVVHRPGRHRLEVRERVPVRVPIRPLTAVDRAALQARRLDAPYPYEVLRFLTSGDEEGHLPHPDLARGRFQELDLDEGGRLVPVDRPPGGNRAGVVVGLITHETARYPEGMTRVWVGSDPTRAMAALAEPECRRVVAALDLAAARDLPVEWVALSAGARIAMDSGTEGLDWTARVLRRLVEFTQAGGEVNVLVAGVNVGAQSYWNAEATMLLHTRGLLVMTPGGAMVLTGARALAVSGGVGAEDERAIGGFERVMGPNGEAALLARDLGEAYALLFDHYRYAYRAPGENRPRRRVTTDPVGRSVATFPYEGTEGFATVGEIFDEATNPGRKRPFSVRAVMAALVDQDNGSLETWRSMAEAGTAVVWDACVDGWPVRLLGIEARGLPRRGPVPLDGPDTWTGSTLFPLGAKKLARALNQASGNRPVVVLANLSGFDGSPESLRRLQLEHGAELGRAVVNFRGRIVFVVLGRYHGGAYVVFSRALNPGLRALALEGSYASVIGGAPAAAVVFPREVRARVEADPRLVAARQAVAEAAPAARARLREQLDALRRQLVLEKQGEVAREFDAVHTVDRAVRVGSLDAVIPAPRLRPVVAALVAEEPPEP